MAKEIVGVALCVRCTPNGTILFIKELKAKLDLSKKAGSLSVPMETVENYETVPNAVLRLIKEEVGPDFLATLAGFQLYEDPVRATYESGVLFTLHVAWVDVEHEFCARPTDCDIEHHGWYNDMQIEQLQVGGKLRVEVPLVLALCHDRMQTTT